MKLTDTQAAGFGKLRRFAEISVYVFIAECTLGSSGRWLEFGPLSIRMVLFAICFFATLPFVFQRIRSLARNPQVIITVAYGVYLLICAWIGLRAGNQKGFIWSDLTTMMTLALVPGFMAVMCDAGSINHAVDVIYWSAVLTAALTVVLHLVLAVINEEIFEVLYGFITGRRLGGMATMQTGIQRIYLRGQIFLQVAIVYGVWKIGKTEGKKRIALHIANGLLLCGCILSYTRGFWLGLAVSALLLLLLGTRYWRQFLSIAGKMTAVFLVFVVVSTACYRGPAVLVEIVNRFNPNLIVWNVDEESYFTPDGEALDIGDMDDILDSDQEAVNMREMTLLLSRQRIKQHPYIGNGLGENLDEIRDDGRTEYMYLDQVVKTGILGALLFGLTYFSFIAVQCIDWIRRRRAGLSAPAWESPVMRNRFLTAAYLGVAVTSCFNPFLNNPMGIMLLLVTGTAVYSAREKKE